MSIPKHIKEHIALGLYGLSGENVYTVGSGGRFATLDAALAFLASETGYEAVSHPATTGDVTQYSDEVTNVSTDLTSYALPGDLIYFDDDEAGAPTIIVTSLAQATYYPIYDLRATTLRLMTGRVGGTGTGVGIQLYRPKKYTIVLLPGFHDLDTSYTLPDRAAVKIMGLSKETTFIAKSGSAAITHARHGYLSLENVTIYGQDGAITSNHTLITEPVALPFDAGFGVFSFNNIDTAVIRPNASATNDLFIFRGSAFFMDNVRASEGFNTIGTVKTDLAVINNIALTSSQNHHCLAVQCVHKYQHTKDWHINNLDLIRKDNSIGDPTRQTDRVLTMTTALYGGAGAGKTIYMRSGKIIDLDSDSSIMGPFYADIGLNDELHINDFVIDYIGTGGVSDIVLDTQNGAGEVFFDNVRDIAGNSPTITDNDGAGVIYNYSQNGLQSLAYSATRSSNPNLGGVIKIGALTGNITMSAPTNPILGQQVTYIFEQDGTGGWTITWDAVFSKSADPAAGTAGQKASTSFRYDGAEWVQIGGALAWA